MKRILFTILFLSTTMLFPQKVTELNNDGTAKFVELSKEQKIDMDSMRTDIQFFHEKLIKLVAYMLKNKPSQIENGNLVKKEIGYIEGSTLSRFSYIVNGDTHINMSGEKIDSLRFSQRKGTIHPKADPNVYTRDIENKFSEADEKTIKLRVYHYPLAFGENNPVEVYNVDNIPDPIERLKMVRHYKENVRKLVRELENIVEYDKKRKNMGIWKTLNEVGG